MTDTNTSDLCVCTALPVKHFRSLVHKMCSDKGKLHTSKQSNEHPHMLPKPPVGWQISKPEPEIPSGGITYVPGASFWLIYKRSSGWRAGLSFPCWWGQWLHPCGNQCSFNGKHHVFPLDCLVIFWHSVYDRELFVIKSLVVNSFNFILITKAAKSYFFSIYRICRTITRKQATSDLASKQCSLLTSVCFITFGISWYVHNNSS